MSAGTPPTSESKRWIAEYASSNGATAGGWSDGARRLVVLGYITAVTMPLIGFIVGIVVTLRLTKPNAKHGALIIVVSVIASVVWILVFASGALTATSTELN